MANQTSFFKIYCKTNGKYLSKYNGKSTWHSLKWALSATRNWLRRGYLSNEIEIHEYPLVDPIVITLQDAEEEMREQSAKIAQKKNAQRIAAARASLLREIENHKERIEKAEKELNNLQ
jgi:predicted  nucleic acid-binding Zn-ribbon protein